MVFSRLPQVLVMTCCCIAAAESSANTVSVTLTPVLEKKSLVAIDASVSFRGNASGITNLKLPNSVTREKELWRAISNLSVRGARMETVDDPARRKLHHEKTSRIDVRYRITQESTDLTEALRHSYRPIIQPNYFHLLGAATLILPEIDSATPLQIRVLNLPKDWKFASNLEHKNTTVATAESSVLLGGEIQVFQPSTSNRQLRVALRGEWPLTAETLAMQAAKIVEGQRRFWGDTPSPYLVTVLQTPRVNLPLGPPFRGGGGTAIVAGGTAFDDGFAMFAPEDVDDFSIDYVLAHEGMHHWIVWQQGGLANEDRGRWLIEGFTEFYKSRLLVRDGVWTPRDFAIELNRVLRTYANSPMRGVSNDYLAENFFKDRDVADQAYQRGRLLALMWDRKLRGGLDPIMHAMRRRANTPVREPSPDALKLLIDETAMAGLDIRNDLAKYVESGQLILLPDDLFEPCGSIAMHDAPEFDRGFDIGASFRANMRVTGIGIESNAYRAGLRDGMRLIRLESGENGDSEHAFAYRVDDNGVERTIRYLPQGEKWQRIQRFSLRENLNEADQRACLGRLAGSPASGADPR